MTDTTRQGKRERMDAAIAAWQASGDPTRIACAVEMAALLAVFDAEHEAEDAADKVGAIDLGDLCAWMTGLGTPPPVPAIAALRANVEAGTATLTDNEKAALALAGIVIQKSISDFAQRLLLESIGPMAQTVLTAMRTGTLRGVAFPIGVPFNDDDDGGTGGTGGTGGRKPS